MRCSSSESGTSLPPSWSMRRVRRVSHTIPPPTTRPHPNSLWSVRVRAARTPLLVASTLDPDALRTSQRGGDDGIVTERVADVIDRLAGVVPARVVGLLEAQLANPVAGQV